ncbi:MAG: PDZ domain-containing protein [Paramuribaculum sp.]|nr:PDZ domain-containing protein [Paramuribaculum sp.]
MKKSVLIAGLLAVAAGASAAADSPLWLRYPAISPDGKTIAFTYQGDIFTVPATGGEARQLTTNPAHDTAPVWSPDGTLIAFASDREGSRDVFVMPATGGAPKRLTTNSGSETPVAFRDNGTVLFSSSVMPDAADIQFPSGQFPQTYSVSVNGGRPVMFSSLAMDHISINPKNGALLYTDKKGYEDPWRKHHTSSIARDIWTANADAKSGFKKLTDFAGEDRNAVWAPDGKSYYFLSERDGSFNVYKAAPGEKPVKLTAHTTHPVRFLSAATNGKMAYSYNGELYTLDEGKQPVKVEVSIIKDNIEKPLVARTQSSGANDIAVSPSGKEVAFILHGDVYVTSIEYNTTKRITDTPQQERDINFSPDGRSLVYSAERGKTWGIYESKIKRQDEKLFTYATEIIETPLVEGEATAFQPAYSPDGKEVAFLENRTALRVINLDSKKTRTVLDGKYNYSYSDGDVTYRWSPDSKWFLVDYIGNGGWNNKDIALVKADGSGELTNLTESGYSDGNAKWVLDGKAMIWSSDRAGYRSHGSWGAEEDTYIMFFDTEAWDRFQLSKEELEQLEEKEKADKDKKDKEEKEKADKDSKDKKGKKDSKKDGDKKDEKPAVKDLKFELDGRQDRIARLTVNSSHMGDAVLSPKGDKLYYMAAFEKGYDLWEHDLKKNTTRILIKGVGGYMNPGKDGEKVYVVSRGGLNEVSFKDAKVKPIPFTAQFNWRPAQEREYIFNHAWRQVQDKFYDPAIHGIDWKGYHDAYARFLPHINNNYDFAEMLSEMLGELNGSHTGARYYASSSAPAVATLGAFYDPAYKGDGLKVTEILTGGPLDKADSKISAGAVIETIDGEKIKAGEDYYPMLAGKAGKKVTLGGKDKNGKSFEQKVTAISSGTQSDLMYKRWISNNRAKVEKLSGGKVGYIHIKGMDSPSFRKTYSDLLGRYRNYDAVIIDTRHNGGGWLHEDLAILLSGKEFARFTPRGQYVGSDPFNRWFKPSCVLVCEDNYSNAHGFPWTYQTLGLGKLIGAPVPGTMTAVWWETQIDPSLVFGIPQVGCEDMQGRYLENLELKPDIEVYNTPAQQLAGEDAQLEAAVKEMLRAIAEKK